MSTDVIYFEDLLIDYLNDVLAKTEKVSPDEYDDMWLDLFSKTKEFVKKADESYLKDNDKVRQEVEELVNIFNDKTLMFPDLVKKALNYITETKQSCFPEKNTVQQFKDLAKKYGFKVVKDGEAYRLCAKNTDHRWTRWISYYPDKDTVSSYGNTDYLNIWLCDTRKDFTPEICLKFIEDLNNLFELKDEDKFLIKDLIDPEDWQEIAGVHDAYEDKRYYPDKEKNISIYKIDSSKLIKFGEEGYQPGQEQAKIYFDTIPQSEEFTIEIRNEKIQADVAEMLDINVKAKERILLSVDNKDSEHIAMTAYYLSSKSETARHFVVSYANTDKGSYYDLANKILKYIEDFLQPQINKANENGEKSVDNSISYATQALEKTDKDNINKTNKETEKEMC